MMKLINKKNLKYFLVLLCGLVIIWLSIFSKASYLKKPLTHPVLADTYIPSQGVTRFIIIRHGETEWNAKGKPQGWIDIPLNANGLAQTEQLGLNLADVPMTAIYTSILSRTVVTAEKIARHHPNVKVILDPTLRFYPKEDEKFAADPTRNSIKIARMASAYLKDLSSKHMGENVVIITHGNVIRYLVESITAGKYRKVKIENTAFVTVLGTPETLILE